MGGTRSDTGRAVRRGGDAETARQKQRGRHELADRCHELATELIGVSHGPEAGSLPGVDAAVLGYLLWLNCGPN